MTREDIQALRIPLIVLAVTLLLATLVVYISDSVLDTAQRQLAQRETQLREARMRIQNAGEEKQMIAQYLGSYRELARAGFVGDEQRINWLDTLRIANEEAGLFGVEYDIGAQKPYIYSAEFDVGELLLQESMMQLRFRLLHEGDLPRFFDALRRHGGAFFTVDQCVLRRIQPPGEKALSVQPNLGAECELRWLTLKPAASSGKKG